MSDRPKGYEERIVYTKFPRVSCSGENNDHPKVWYEVPEVGKGQVVCGYCDTKFERVLNEDSWTDETEAQVMLKSRGFNK